MYLPFLSRFGKQIIPLREKGLFLRHPRKSDMSQWIELRRQSTEFLKPWEPKWPEDDLSPVGFSRRLRIYNSQSSKGSGRTFFLFQDDGERLLGGISLTRIQRGRRSSATLGYWMGRPHAGKGHSDADGVLHCIHTLLSWVIDQIDWDCIVFWERNL